MAQAAEPNVPPRRNGKSEAAFRTISEVAADLDVPQHVLRFWETRFAQIKPMKRGGGRRYYRPEDVELLRRIRALLYDDGYTIKGVQKLLKQSNGLRLPAGDDEAGEGTAEPPQAEAAMPPDDVPPAADPAVDEAPASGDAEAAPAMSAAQRQELTGLLEELEELSRLLRRAEA